MIAIFHKEIAVEVVIEDNIAGMDRLSPMLMTARIDCVSVPVF